MNELAVNQPGNLAIRNPSPSEILAAVVAGGITPDNVGVLERIIALQREMRKEDAAREFTDALAALQAETGKIVAMKPVPAKDGSIKYHYAPLEDIMTRVRPLLTKHGFSISFDTEISDGRLTSICHLTHKGGHSKANRFSVRMGDGPPHASAAQADGSSATFAKRYGLCDALAIVISQDDDARGLGPTIETSVAAALEERARLAIEENPVAGRTTETRLKTLHERVGARSFSEIPAKRVPEVEAMIAKLTLSKPGNPTPKRDQARGNTEPAGNGGGSRHEQTPAEEAANAKETDPTLFT